MTKKGSIKKMPQSLIDTMSEMPMMFYADWFRKDVSPHLSKAQKEKLIKKVAEFSEHTPINLPNIEIPLDEFPGLKPYAHTSNFTGLQIYAVYEELFHELYPKSPMHRPYPLLPDRKMRA